MNREKKTGINPIITYCHFFGAFLVFVGHFYVLTGRKAPTFAGKGIQGLGVGLLFLISGFLSCNSIKMSKFSGRKFVIKKLKRIIPPLWTCLALTVVFLFFLSETKDRYFISALKFFLSNAFLIPRHTLAGVFENNPYPVAVNGSLWTLPIEMICFISIPSIFCFFKKIESHMPSQFMQKMTESILLVTMCIIINIMMSFDVVGKVFLISDGSLITSAMRITVWFLTGVLFSTITSQKAIAGIGVIGIIACIIIPGAIEFTLPYIIGCIFKELVQIGTMPIASRLPVPKDICYGIYLYGFPVEQIIIYLFKVKNNIETDYVLMFAIAFIIDILLAIISYYFVEQRFKAK